MKIVALVGMAGSGKSEVSRIFEKAGYKRVRFGDVTDEEVARRGLKLNEANEKLVRESFAMHSKSTDKPSVLRKIDNTIAFLEAVRPNSLEHHGHEGGSGV